MSGALPDYLRGLSEADHYYGELSHDPRTGRWVIKGEPCVCALARKVLPGCESRRRGYVRFNANKRVIGELNWLMQRYPLRVGPRSAARWASCMEEARRHALFVERMRTSDERQKAHPIYFNGELLPFQERGLSYLCNVDRCLLADEMGLGKTLQALAYLCHRQVWPVLVVVPPHLTLNWEKEIRAFMPLREGMGQVRVHRIKGLKQYALPESDVFLIHYLLLKGWKETLLAMGPRIVVFDEVQELRHTGTQKYSVASLVSAAAESVVALSGTPLYNRGGEIWGVMNIVDHHCLSDYESFTREWCTGYGNDVVKDPEMLGAHLRREGLILRRLKRDVLAELPPKRRVALDIDADMRAYDAMMAEAFDDVRLLVESGLGGDPGIGGQGADGAHTAEAAEAAAIAAIAANDVDGAADPSLASAGLGPGGGAPGYAEYPDGFAEASLLQRIVVKERQATGLAKAPQVCAFVRSLLDSGERVLLFAHHHKVMDIYREGLKAHSPAFITGREAAIAKEKAVERFMGGGTDLCCVSLRAATGLNLQAATCVVFGELDWSPAIHSQAEDRCHRMGQKDSVLCYYLIAEGGSDYEMRDALGLKVSQFAGIMGDGGDRFGGDGMLSAVDVRKVMVRIVERLYGRLSARGRSAGGAD